MQGSEPDRAADGLKAVMKAVADTYNRSLSPCILFGDLIKYTSMHRLTFDKYIHRAIDDGLIARNGIQIWIEDKGLKYLEIHNIIEP